MTVNLPTEQKFIDQLTETIEANFSNGNFGVAELAEQMGMSHSTLHRKLRAIASQSISQFIRETRLKHAMELLRLQAGTVSEIAFGVGFSSTTYFSKCFHDQYGYPPGDVKRRFITESDDDTGSQMMERSGNLIESIAVLPFDNYSGDDSNAYLVFGMHDTLISELGQLGGLRVISKTSTLCFAGSNKSIKEIANDLGVDAIIEGSVLSVEDTIRLDLKMFSAFPEEKQRWAQTFEMDLSNILKIFSEVIKNIASEIQMKLSPDKQISLDEAREINPESYKAILRGKYNMCQQTPDGVKKGLEYLHQAVLIDPAEPLAYAGLAEGYMDLAHGPFNPGDAYEKAESAVKQAMKLDKYNPEALTGFAELCVFATWKFDLAERYFKRSLELNPNLSRTHYAYAWTLYLFGRNEEAVREQELAMKFDPFNPLMVATTGAIYAYVGRFEDGLREAYRSLEVQKDYPFGYWSIGEIYLELEQYDKAVKAHEKLVEIGPEWTWRLGMTYALTGQREKAEELLVQLENGPIISWTAMGLAALYGTLGRFDEAFKWLTFKPHHLWIPWVACMPMWKSLYDDPRYDEFVKNLNLPKS
jgi:TolB-like protein/Flp pilus assembly protein TadD